MRQSTDPSRVRRPDRPAPWRVLAAISAGGVLGAGARHGLALAWPPRPGQIPWSTLLTNVSGCLLIGVLTVLLTRVWPTHRLLRPFLAVGILGGYTTFSTYVVEAANLLAAGHPGTALGYLGGTLVAALAAVYGGITATRRAIGHSEPPPGRPATTGVPR